MTSPTKIPFTIEEERTITHITSLSTALYSTCHIATGYDVSDAGRYPYTANILQTYGGSFTVMYDECRGPTRHHALLRLLREVEVDMHEVCRRALEGDGSREGGEQRGREREKATKVAKRRKTRADAGSKPKTRAGVDVNGEDGVEGEGEGDGNGDGDGDGGGDGDGVVGEQEGAGERAKRTTVKRSGRSRGREVTRDGGCIRKKR